MGGMRTTESAEGTARDGRSERVLQWGRRAFATERFRNRVPITRELATLQWGRRAFATESSRRRPRRQEVAQLQWGRRAFATESAIPAAHISGELVRASMGPPRVRDGESPRSRKARGLRH